MGATTPARISVVTSDAFLSPDKPPKNAAAFAQAQEYVVRDPVHVLWPEITQRIYTTKMDELWSGAKDAATVAQEIAAEANPLFGQLPLSQFAQILTVEIHFAVDRPYQADQRF